MGRRIRAGSLAIAAIALFAGALIGPVPAANAAGVPVSQVASGRCIDLAGGTQPDGKQLTLWDCNGGSNQAITLTAARELQINGRCVDAYGGGTTDGAQVVIWTCSGAVNQKWTQLSDGSLKSDNGKCIEAPGGQTGNGVGLQVWACNGGTNQRWSSLGGGGGGGSTNPRIDVDLSYSLGAVTYAASGALYGLGNPGVPAASTLTGLNMQTIGQMAPGGTQHPDGDALKVGPQFFAAGGQRVMIYAQDFYPDWPYQKVSMTAYGNVIATQMSKVAAAPNASKYAWVPFNEPDWIWYGSSGTKLTNFLNDWKTIFQKIRSINPSAVIVGPSFEAYNSSAYRSFLTFAKANNVLPNIMAWHELGSDFGTQWYNHYNDYRSIEDQVGVSDIPININEYGMPAEMGVPGKMIQYLARFDATRVGGCMASWWAGEFLGRTLNSNGQKTSGWYLYNWYGQANGNSARVTPPDGNGALQAFASIASNKASARVVLGGANGSSDVKFTGIASTSLGNSIQVRISTLANSGTSQSSGPVLNTTTTATVSNGSITVTVPNMSANNVYLIQLG